MSPLDVVMAIALWIVTTAFLCAGCYWRGRKIQARQDLEAIDKIVESYENSLDGYKRHLDFLKDVIKTHEFIAERYTEAFQGSIPHHSGSIQ